MLGIKLEQIGSNNLNRISIIDESGQILLFGNLYSNKYLAVKRLSSILKNVSDPHKYLYRKNHFSLRAGNHREIGRSPKMTPEKMEEAIGILLKYGAKAKLVEE